MYAITQTDEHGLVKHVDQLNGILCWYPPCQDCMAKESAKVQQYS
jgi:hypothetical protein